MSALAIAGQFASAAAESESSGWPPWWVIGLAWTPLVLVVAATALQHLATIRAHRPRGVSKSEYELLIAVGRARRGADPEGSDWGSK